MLNTATTSASKTIPTRDPDQLLAIIDELHQHNELLRQKVYYLTHKRFGASSEKVSESQVSLFDSNSIDTIDETIELKPEDIDVTSHKRARRSRHDVFAGLPVERIEIDLNDEEKTCDCCGGDLHRIGEDTHREIEFIPAVLKVKEIVHVKYGCRECEIGVRKYPFIRHR
jgi:transposase